MSIGIAVIFSLFIIGDKPFFLNQDQMRQYEIFYQEWLRLLNVFVKTGEAPFYSWNLFLGSDFLISKFYYVTGDPFVLLFALLPFSVHRFLILESIFCVYIAGCLFYWFLKEFGITNKSVRITTALLYAFSGFTVHYYGNFMFFRFFAFLPLLFVGVERYLQKKQTGIFIFAVLLLIFQSYYFMFPTSFFLVFYVLFSYLHRGNRFDFRKIIKLALPLIGAYLIGILLSMVFLLPTIMMVLQNTRLGVVSEATGLFWSFKTILGYLFSLITPPFNIWTWYYPYIFTEGYGYAFWCSLYTSAFAVIALFWQLLYGKQKKLFRIFLGVLFAFMVVLPLNSMLHGFSEPSSRWFFLVVLFLCLIFAITMQEFKNIDTKQLIHSYGLFTFLILLGFILLNLFKQIDYSIHGSNILGFTIPLLLGWLYVFLLHKKLKRIVYILAVAEAVVGCMLTASVTTLGNQMPVNQIEPAFFMSLQEQDSESAFRIYIDSIFYQPYSSLNLNQPLKLGYMGTSTYDTIYAFELNDFLHLNGFYQHFIELKDIEVLKMLGV
ncbi:MAG: YfhO family protein, partial [Erysipelotrichaceae bacterium]|nr:YfhO family protein [Erysipelotrichaceae bacterium]